MTYSQQLNAPRQIVRAKAQDIAFFADAPVGNIVDALGRAGAMDAQIKPITKAAKFAGSALTVNAGPRDNLAPWAALRLAKPGDVMVIATGGHMEASVCGDLLVGMARNASIVAIVTDGVVRDISGTDAVGIPVFCGRCEPQFPAEERSGIGRFSHRGWRHRGIIGRYRLRRRGRSCRGSGLAAGRGQGGFGCRAQQGGRYRKSRGRRCCGALLACRPSA